MRNDSDSLAVGPRESVVLRYLAGVASTLLLIGAAIFIWKSRAEADPVIPPAPEAAALVTPLKREPIEKPPSAPDKSREEKRFARYDKDENGNITRAEMLESRRKAYAKLDTNGDGRLNFEEWAIATSNKFKAADADRSGNLTPAEFLTTKREAKSKKCDC